MYSVAETADLQSEVRKAGPDIKLKPKLRPSDPLHHAAGGRVERIEM